MNTSGILTRRQKRNGEQLEETENLQSKATKPNKLGSGLGSLNFNINAPDFEEFTDLNIKHDLNRGQRRRATKKNDLHEPGQLEEDRRQPKKPFASEEEGLYARCKALEVGYFEELETYVSIAEQQVREANARPAQAKQRLVVEVLAANYTAAWKEQVAQSEQYNEAQRQAVGGLVERFAAGFAKEQDELNQKCLEESNQPVLRENLMNLLQRDRETVLDDLEEIMRNMEESLSETYDQLRKDYLEEVDQKLSSVLENQKTVVYDQDLNNEIVNRSTKAKNQFKDKYERVIEDMLANDQKMSAFLSQNFELEDQLNSVQTRLSSPLVEPFKHILDRGALDSISQFLGK
jgi:hypothetical protein